MLSLGSRAAATRSQCEPDRDADRESLHMHPNDTLRPALRFSPALLRGPRIVAVAEAGSAGEACLTRAVKSGTIDLEAGDRPSPQGHSPDRVRSSRTASLLSVFLFLEVEDNTEFGRGNVSFRLRNLGSTNRSARQRCG